MPKKNLKHIHMILVWGSTLIISVKNSTLSNFLFKECFASKQFLENKELVAHHENTIHTVPQLTG